MSSLRDAVVFFFFGGGGIITIFSHALIDDFDESTIRLRLKKEVELFWRKKEKKKIPPALPRKIWLC